MVIGEKQKSVLIALMRIGGQGTEKEIRKRTLYKTSIHNELTLLYKKGLVDKYKPRGRNLYQYYLTSKGKDFIIFNSLH